MSPTHLLRLAQCSVAVAAILCLLAPSAHGKSPATDNQGRLQALGQQGKTLGDCPLKHTDVQVDIAGFIARVTVKQQFQNPFADKIEAVYTFPLSQDAAVDRMTMTIGDRVIEGQIKERSEARRVYNEAKAAGKVASLLDQERPNIFTQAVANIEPGAQVDITISYSETLDWIDGMFHFAFPMVVGPRYVPGQPVGPGGLGFAPPTTQVPDADRVTPQPTLPGTRAGHDISVTVRLDAGLPIRYLESKQHQVDTEYGNPEKSRAVVKLKDAATLPNKDFVLEYQTSSDQIEDTVLTHTDERGKFFALVLQPPKRVRTEAVVPKELIFAIDKSGSMTGFPIETAKRAMALCINGMQDNDTFNLITFDGGTTFCFPHAVPKTDQNLAQAQQYLANLRGSGGTEMMKAVNACLADQHDPERVRVVCFMTDGYVANDMAIIDAIRQNAGTARVFAFGIGTSVNRFLLDGMARAGRGEVQYILSTEQADGAAERFYERVRMPVLTDIQLDFGALAVEDVFPKGFPDLFSSKPVVVKGRYKAGGQGTIVLRGKTGAGAFQRKIPVRLPDQEPKDDVLASLWARANVDYLMGQDMLGIQRNNPNPAIKEEILGLGLRYRLLTQFTSFVAVESQRITKDGKLVTVPVPVEMPEGVSYEGVFGAPAARSSMGMMGGMMGGGMGGGGGGRGGAAGGAEGAGGRGKAGGAASDAMNREQGISPPPAKSAAKPQPAPALDAKAQAKLAPELRGLAQKLSAAGTTNLTVGNVRVENGQVKIRVKLANISDQVLAELKKLGFQEVSRSATENQVVGTIPVSRLEDLAKLQEVQQIDPAP